MIIVWFTLPIAMYLFLILFHCPAYSITWELKPNNNNIANCFGEANRRFCNCYSGTLFTGCSVEMAHCFLLALFFVIQSLEVSGLTVEEFIPFGESNGDTVFFSNDDNTTSITIPLKCPFFSSLYSTIHVRVC